MIASAARNPRRHRPAALAAGCLPQGLISTRPLQGTIRRVVPHGWAEHPNHWVVACDYADGRRVAFGREDAPRCDLARAVAASCAIPGFYRPVRIEGRRYVDGGLWSPSNLDILRNAGLDLVICLNPMSSLKTARARRVTDRLSARLRQDAGRRLGREAQRLRDAGTAVVLIQPTAAGEQLRDTAHRDQIARLPVGEPHRVSRPAGSAASWPPDLLPAARAAAPTPLGER